MLQTGGNRNRHPKEAERYAPALVAPGNIPSGGIHPDYLWGQFEQGFNGNGSRRPRVRPTLPSLRSPQTLQAEVPH
jgi:hypothetical protein